MSKICDRVGIIKDGRLLKVEPVKKIIDKSLSYVTITSNYCDQIIKDLKLQTISHIENTIVFKNILDSNSLLKSLVKYDIEKIYIESASLEDIFLHYYK